MIWLRVRVLPLRALQVLQWLERNVSDARRKTGNRAFDFDSTEHIMMLFYRGHAVESLQGEDSPKDVLGLIVL